MSRNPRWLPCTVLLIGVIGVVGIVRAADPSASDKAVLPRLSVSQERPDATYKHGETAKFTIRVENKDGSPLAGKMTVEVGLTQDGGKPLAETRKMEIGSEPVPVEFTLTEPGFFRCQVIGRQWQGKDIYERRTAVAVYAPEKIEPVVKMPGDFDEFWQKGRDRLAKIPVDAQLTKIPERCNDERDFFKVSFANIDDTRIYGYLSVPKGGKAPYPAMVSVSHAGVGKPKDSYIDSELISYSGPGVICLYMGVYSHDLGLTRDWYRNTHRKEPGYKGVRPDSTDPEEYLFRRSILGIDRAIDWLASRDDFDGKHLVYSGASQGGGMGLVLAGLNKKITAAAVGIPGLCDHLSFQVGREPGWPQVLGARARRPMTPEQIEGYTKMMPYFDAVNFARKIEVPVLMSMGYLDTTCPPSSVYSAYNTITAPKKLIADPNAGHLVTKGFTTYAKPWIRSRLGLTDETLAP